MLCFSLFLESILMDSRKKKKRMGSNPRTEMGHKDKDLWKGQRRERKKRERVGVTVRKIGGSLAVL